MKGDIAISQYAIMRFAKHKGGSGALEAHHERKKEKYASNPDIDPNRKSRNFHIIQPERTYWREVDNRIKAAGCKTRKDSVRFVDTLITASPEFFKGKKRVEVQAFFKTAVDFLAQRIGRDNIFAATVHMDEKTPHLHLCFTPITQDGRLSAKEIIGNRTQLTKWQDDFFAHMVKKFPNLERGESASKTGRRHIPTRVLKESVALTKQAEKIQEVLDSINPINAKKKKEELAPMLHKFIPQAESYFTHMKRYKREFERQERENAALEKEIADGKLGLSERLQMYNLQRDYEQLKRVYSAVPEEERKKAARAVFRPQRQSRDYHERG